MPIVGIEPELCGGCRKCEQICPADVIRINNESGKAFIQYPEDCVTCFKCLADCAQNAITMSVVETSPLFTSWG